MTIEECRIVTILMLIVIIALMFCSLYFYRKLKKCSEVNRRLNIDLKKINREKSQ